MVVLEVQAYSICISVGKLFNGTIVIIGSYPRVVTDEVKGYDNRITPPKDQIDRSTSIGKKLPFDFEVKKYFTTRLVDEAIQTKLLNTLIYI